MDSEVARRRRARLLLIVAVIVIGGCIALVLWQRPPASIAAAIATAVCVLLLTGIADPFLLMLLGNGRNPFARALRGRDADLEPVEPRSGPEPEPGLWTKGDVFRELARLVVDDGLPLRVLSTRSRVRLERTDASSPVACDLVVIGHQLLEHHEVGDPDGPRRDIHALIDRVVETTSWQIAGEIVQR